MYTATAIDLLGMAKHKGICFQILDKHVAIKMRMEELNIATVYIFKVHPSVGAR